MNTSSNKSRLACRVAFGGVALALAGAAQAARPVAQTEAPVVAGEQAEVGPRCKGEAARPAQVALQMGKSTLMRLPEPVQNRSVGNPSVVQAMLAVSYTYLRAHET